MLLDVVVDCVVVVESYATLAQQLVVSVCVELCTVCVKTEVVVGRVVGAHLGVVVEHCGDEIGTVEHVRSMAEIRWKVKRWWTPYQLTIQVD